MSRSSRDQTVLSPPEAGTPLRDVVFVGRSRELAELQANLAAALAGNGRLLLLAGEPGIGKTRLTELAGCSPPDPGGGKRTKSRHQPDSERAHEDPACSSCVVASSLHRPQDRHLLLVHP